MPSTRSSGPPTAASLQPILMEALENFKQKHSKQNQDLIHKNRFLLKSTAELERVVKELKNENLELRIQIQKSHSQAQYWRQRAESSSSSINPDHTQHIRMALIDITNRCKALESSLSNPQQSLPNSSKYPEQAPTLNSTLMASSSTNPLPTLLAARSRADLLALRERRRSQFQVEPEESRLSFIHECSGTEDRSESTLPHEAFSDRIPNVQKALDLRPQLEFEEEGSEETLKENDANETDNSNVAEDQASGSFSLHNRAMSILDESSSSDTSDSDPDLHEDGDEDTLSTRKPDSTRQKDQKSLLNYQRRSRKQRRTSLTPLHILENISPAEFSLSAVALPSPDSSVCLNESNQSRRTDRSDETKLAGTELYTPTLATQSANSKRRDSGLTKEETDETSETQLSQDEGWEKRPTTKKRRVRSELDAVCEELTATANNNGNGVVHPPAINHLSGAGSREARRARKEVNYALPSLNKKMRRPDSEGLTKGKRKSSIKHNTNQGLQASTTASHKPRSAGSIKSSGATPSYATEPKNNNVDQD
ncbi:hypothetical protein PCANC_27043 [Puccinia coronata f. sp. avenae]|uniref:Shugoshin C-terminal domain-containing protein n=1 Tax=Puccinia coronata f. sp. avenae TaxID=200324 RepID=A0A2N5S2B9_9BASI|nr:hypothetical protein PCANC_27043 [Puccinia coronata f. sp. avenae]PLW22051.1 hypothetical protein PCASD_19445 [Puccinia coronata f. sp. avenae]PLW32250.1 hypothetical protein PCASD_17821 [Puccinia coronata f. sp. avenae]